MKKKLATAVLSVLTACCLCLGVTFAFADTPGKAAGETYVYFEAGDASELSHYFEAESDGVTLGEDRNQYGNDPNEYSSARILTGGKLVYSFDFEDSVSRAALTVFAGNRLKIEYSANGAAYALLSPNNANLPDPGVIWFDLNSTNVFAAGNSAKTFKLRITSSDGVQLNVSRLMIRTDEELALAQGETLTVNSDTKQEMENVFTNYGFSRRFTDDVNGIFWYSNQTYERYMIYRFDLPNNVSDATVAFEMGPWGDQNVTASVSADGNAYTAAVSGASIKTLLAGSVDKVFYLKLLAPAADPAVENYIRSASVTVVSVETPADEISETYFTAGTAAEEKFLSASGSADYETLIDDLFFEGVGAVPKARKMTPGSTTLLYSFDLPDSAAKRELVVYGSRTVETEWSIGGTTFTKFAKQNVSDVRREVVRYTLGGDNVLGADNSDHKFYIRITAAAEAENDACFRSIAIVDPSAEIEGTTLELSPMSEAESRYTYSMNGAQRHFGGGTSPYWWLNDAEGSIVFRLRYPEGHTNITASFVNNWTAAPKMSVSTNGTTYTEILNGGNLKSALVGIQSGTFYLKLQKSTAQAYVSKLTLTYTPDDVPGRVNENENLPSNVPEAYFFSGSEEESKFLFEDQDANRKRSALGIDGYEGGYYKNNARVLSGNGYMLYEFDLADSVSAAKLKILGGGTLTVEVSADGFKTSEVLTALNKSGIRGYSIYGLTESDALSGTNRKFAVKVSSHDGVISAVYVGTGSGEISESVYVTPGNESGLKYLADSNLTNRFYPHQYFYAWYLNAKAEGDSEKSRFEYRFDLADGINSAKLSMTFGGSFKVLAKAEGGTYADFFVSTLSDKIGDYPTNVFSLDELLKNNPGKVIYLKFERSNTDVHGLISDIAILLGSGAKESGSFSAYSGSESDYLYETPMDRDGISSVRLFNADGGEKLVYGRLVNDSITYRFNLASAASRVRFTIDAVGSFEAYVSTDGSSYRSAYKPLMGLSGPYTFDLYDLFGESAGRTVYLRLNKSGENAFRFKEVSFTTAGVPDKPPAGDDGAGDRFDYDEDHGELPGEIDLGQKPPHEIVGGSEMADNSLVWIIAGSAGGVLLLGGGAAAFVIIRKKKGGSKQ